jgi:hypothetical protein
MNSNADNGKSGEGKIPYTSYTTFGNFLDRMKDEGGAPSRVDRSYLSNMPGGVRGTFIHGLKAMGLVDDDLTPSPELHQLVTADADERKQIMEPIIRRIYERPLALAPMATQAQLETAFREYGISGSTLRRAVGFFLAATEDVGIRVSPHFKLPKIPPSSSAPRSRSAARTAPPASAPTPPGTPAHASLPQLHPLIEGLIRELPPIGQPFPKARQESWFAIAQATFNLIYGTSSAPDEPPEPPVPPEPEEDA